MLPYFVSALVLLSTCLLQWLSLMLLLHYSFYFVSIWVDWSYWSLVVIDDDDTVISPCDVLQLSAALSSLLLLLLLLSSSLLLANSFCSSCGVSAAVIPYLFVVIRAEIALILLARLTFVSFNWAISNLVANNFYYNRATSSAIPCETNLLLSSSSSSFSTYVLLSASLLFCYI